jgi:hypothetical protein
MQILLDISRFIRDYGPWGLVVLVLAFLLVLVVDEDRAAIWRARIFKAVFLVTGRTQAEKRYISNDIKGRLNTARSRHYFGKALLPRAVDVVWVEGGTGAVNEIKEGEFVVRLDPSHEQERNIALLASSIVKRTTLVGIRHSVEEPLQLAIDLNLVRCLLAEIEDKSALDYFLSNEYAHGLERSEATRNWNDQITVLDERGLFTRILLVELEEFARTVHGMPPRLFMAGEIEGLVSFLHRIATKRGGEMVPLQYHRAYIRIAVIIVAQTHKLLQSIDPYMNMMNALLARDFNSIYVLGADKEWLGDADPQAYESFRQQLGELLDAIDTGTTATKVFDVPFFFVDHRGRRRKGRCVRYVAPRPSVG